MATLQFSFLSMDKIHSWLRHIYFYLLLKSTALKKKKRVLLLTVVNGNNVAYIIQTLLT